MAKVNGEPMDSFHMSTASDVIDSVISKVTGGCFEPEIDAPSTSEFELSEKKPQKRPWSNAESLWSKLKEKQDKAQMEMDIKVEEALSGTSTPMVQVTENGTPQDSSEKSPSHEGTPESQWNPVEEEEDVKMNAEMPAPMTESVKIESTKVPEGGSSRRKPKKVVRNSAVPVQIESLPSTSSVLPMAEESDLNSVWLEGDDDKFFGSPQAQDMNDLLAQFWQTLEGQVDIVQPSAPEDVVDLEGMVKEIKQRPARNLAEIRRQDEEKLTEMLKAGELPTALNISDGAG